jgi:hypothetical protein
VFATGITLEAAARNAAEAAAQEYLRDPPGPMDQPAPPADSTYYARLHELAAKAACREAKGLDNATYVGDDPATLGIDEEACPSMPAIQVCVHDNVDPLCSQTAFGAAIPDPGCSSLTPPPDNTMTGGSETSRYVEVRICYRFTTLFNLAAIQLPFGWSLPIGDVWLAKDRTFTVGYYPPLPTPVPPPPPPPPPSQPAPTDTPSPSPTPTTTATPLPTPTPTPVCQVPIANFTAAPTTGMSPLLVQFTDSSVALDCPIRSWDWDFGDGSPHTSTPNPSRTFVWNGPAGNHTFTVTLTVSSAAGSATKTVNVKVNKP